VADGRVLVGGAPALTAARAVARGEPIRVLEPRRFVGRGGDKLDGALELLGVEVRGRTALDVGASTGGFTDCLLSRGARLVLAVDVGRAQLHERLLADPRVRSLEGTNVRDLQPVDVAGFLGGPAEVVTADLSFTSLTGHLATLVGLGAPDATLVVLVKPQFEVDHATASRGRGVIRDPGDWRAALDRCVSAIRAAGAGIMGVVASPLPGASGNAEFFVHALSGGSAREGDVGAALDDAIGVALARGVDR